MRVAREKLIFICLCVLVDWRERSRGGPVKPDFGLRVALAVLFAFSRSGERERYDRFWRCLPDPQPSTGNDSQRDIFRSNEAHACFEWITRDVGAPGDMAYRSRLSDAVHGPVKHPWRPGSAFDRGAGVESTSDLPDR